MNKIFIITALFLLPSMNAQDKIFLTSGDNIEAKVLEVGINVVKYKKTTNIDGPIYSIDKNEIQLLLYENGSSEIFTNNGTINAPYNDPKEKEKIKNYIVNNINKYGYWENSGSKKYEASFEGDYLRLVVPSKSGSIGNQGLILDFSNVYRFGNVDKRKKGVTFLNIWVTKINPGKKQSQEKHKLVMRVHGYENADNINNALKKYNKLLIETSNY